MVKHELGEYIMVNVVVLRAGMFQKESRDLLCEPGKASAMSQKDGVLTSLLKVVLDGMIQVESMKLISGMRSASTERRSGILFSKGTEPTLYGYVS